MRQRLAHERRSHSRRQPDWIWIAVLLVVVAQIGIGLFMSFAISAQAAMGDGIMLRPFAGYI